MIDEWADKLEFRKDRNNRSGEEELRGRAEAGAGATVAISYISPLRFIFSPNSIISGRDDKVFCRDEMGNRQDHLTPTASEALDELDGGLVAGLFGLGEGALLLELLTLGVDHFEEAHQACLVAELDKA